MQLGTTRVCNYFIMAEIQKTVAGVAHFAFLHTILSLSVRTTFY
jgi:hypothetical protein